MKHINIGLDPDKRDQVSEMLTKILADTYVLYHKTQVSHWNVEDKRFHALHAMFQEQYELLEEAIDEIAERIRAIGHKAPLGLSHLMNAAKIKEYDHDLGADDMLKALLEDHELICQELRHDIAKCADLGDDGNADFLTARLEEHEKTAWMLRSSI